MNQCLGQLDTPYYVIDRGLLADNLSILDSVQKRTGCKILMALKGYAVWSTFDQISEVLYGCAVSSLHEARLSQEYFKRHTTLYAPAYRSTDIEHYIDIVDHIVFNSFSQWHKYKDMISASNKPIQCALRINPECSQVKTRLYDPSAPYSRLGIRAQDFNNKDLTGITGLHFHNLCELNADALEQTLAAVEKKFGHLLKQMQWVNFGGGHHITGSDYDIDLLCTLISEFQNKYQVQVLLEPGTAVVLNTGFLVSTVLDIVHNNIDIAILDTSAAAHMPDVLEMPYRPEIINADKPQKKQYTYRLTGSTCLAGDIIGDYSFAEPLEPGQRLVFKDMAHYTIVKNTMFNGINLPDIVIYDSRNNTHVIQRHFNYDDFKTRLS